MRRLDEKLLEESLEDLYENAPCGYVSTLPDGTFLKVNRTFLASTGYEREELLGSKRLQDLLTIAGKIFHETHYAPLLQMQGFANEIAFDLVCRNGEQISVLINTVQKRDENGAPLINRTTIFNVSDRRKYERELLLARRKAEQAAQAKMRFVSTISHEIKNPLSAITLAVQALERLSDDPKHQRYMRVLRSSSQNLLALVNDILDYGRVEAGMVTLEAQPLDLRELIADVVTSVEARAEEKGIALEVIIDERLPAQLIGDPTKIGQVLRNLVGNAVKFTEQGYVRISVVVSEEHPDAVALHFSVEDTGIGIAPSRLAYIFEEFAQASSDISARYGGTGLGLAISRKLVQLHGSDIQVRSTPEQGSTFSFDLEIKKEPEQE